jgi:hypothetical protein
LDSIRKWSPFIFDLPGEGREIWRGFVLADDQDAARAIVSHEAGDQASHLVEEIIFKYMIPSNREVYERLLKFFGSEYETEEETAAAEDRMQEQWLRGQLHRLHVTISSWRREYCYSSFRRECSAAVDQLSSEWIGRINRSSYNQFRYADAVASTRNAAILAAETTFMARHGWEKCREAIASLFVELDGELAILPFETVEAIVRLYMAERSDVALIIFKMAVKAEAEHHALVILRREVHYFLMRFHGFAALKSCVYLQKPAQEDPFKPVQSITDLEEIGHAEVIAHVSAMVEKHVEEHHALFELRRAVHAFLQKDIGFGDLKKCTYLGEPPQVPEWEAEIHRRNPLPEGSEYLP